MSLQASTEPQGPTLLGDFKIEAFTPKAAVLWDQVLARYSTGQPGLAVGSEVVVRLPSARSLLPGVLTKKSEVTSWHTRPWRVRFWTGEGCWCAEEELLPIRPPEPAPILGVEVDWCLNRMNPPQLRVRTAETLEDRLARVASLPWIPFPTDRRCTFYVRVEPDGFYSFLYHNPKDEWGFGGRVWELPLIDGSNRTIKGPWSSGEQVLWQLTGIAAVNVTVLDPSGLPYSSHVGVSTLRNAVAAAGLDIEIGLHDTQTPYWRVTTPKNVNPGSGKE